MQDEDFMREALELARNAEGRTSPNPMVGAVIVRGGRIVAAGTPEAIMADPNSVTGKFLTEERRTRRKLGDG